MTSVRLLVHKSTFGKRRFAYVVATESTAQQIFILLSRAQELELLGEVRVVLRELILRF